MLTIEAVVVMIFAAIHLFAGRLRFLSGTPRSIWLSLAGGISVAYIFVHLLPELGEFQEPLGSAWEGVVYLEHHVYLVALIGLVLFYGLERMVRASRQKRQGVAAHKPNEQAPGPAAFWLHMGSFALYNGLVGYLLVNREDQSVASLFFYALAMGLHFLVNDYGLRGHHKGNYHRWGRWILAAAIVLGWWVGLLTSVSEALVGTLFAFLAGGVILNVLKEELPEERNSRFWAFAGGAVLYAVLLLMR